MASLLPTETSPSAMAGHHAVAPAASPQNPEARPLWTITALIMLIVFGPAIAAWALTTFRILH